MFREEAMGDRHDSLMGQTSLAVPMSWQAIGYFLLMAIVVGLIFVSTAEYSRVETVTGSITPESGTSIIHPSRSGTVADLDVVDGQLVEAGDLLVSIRTQEDSSQNLSPTEEIGLAIASQNDSLTSQITAANASASAERSRRLAQQVGLRSEIEQIRVQIGLQRSLIEAAQADLDRAHKVAERGFLSQRDLQVREETLLSRRQALSQLNQNLSAKRTVLAETARLLSQGLAQAQTQTAALEATRAQVRQQAALNAGARSYSIRAPVSGRVTAVAARVGQLADPQVPLMTVVPSGGKLQAELMIPSAAIGFVREGQEVSLAIDAYPYQKFGTIKGTVHIVARSASTQESATGVVTSAYAVLVTLETDTINAFGRNSRLMPDMTLTARIVTDKQTLIEWLFEPFYAVRRR